MPKNETLLLALAIALSVGTARADTALYIFHGINSDSAPAAGVELVCLGSGKKIRKCHASRTRGGAVTKSAVVPTEKATALISRFYKKAQKSPSEVKAPAGCSGPLSFTLEWAETRRTETICGDSKREQSLTGALFQAEHAIAGILNP